MPQVAIAPNAIDFGATHAVADVGLFGNVAFSNRLKETWPARARVKFRIGREQRQPTAGAGVNALRFVIEQGSAKFRFAVDTRENLFAVSKLLAQLPPEQREAVRLLILEELSGREAAKVANVPEGTLASRLHNAKAKLRSWLTSRPARGIWRHHED